MSDISDETVRAAARAIHRYDMEHALSTWPVPNDHHRAEALAAVTAAYLLLRAQWEADPRSIVGNVPESVFRAAAVAVDPIDPGDTQRNPSFRAAVEAGWIHGRASCGVAISEWALWAARQSLDAETAQRVEARDEQEDQ